MKEFYTMYNLKGADYFGDLAEQLAFFYTEGICHTILVHTLIDKYTQNSNAEKQNILTQKVQELCNQHGFVFCGTQTILENSIFEVYANYIISEPQKILTMHQNKLLEKYNPLITKYFNANFLSEYSKELLKSNSLDFIFVNNHCISNHMPSEKNTTAVKFDFTECDLNTLNTQEEIAAMGCAAVLTLSQYAETLGKKLFWCLTAIENNIAVFKITL